MYHKENKDYADLIWEDLQYQIDNRQSKVRRHEIMPYSRLKFINKGDIYQVYGKPIPDTSITDEIKKSKAYKMYFKYFTGLIPLKRGRGRGAQEGKTTVTPQKPTKPKKKSSKKKQVLRDESDESEGEPANRLTGRKKRKPRALEIDTQKAVKASQRECKIQHHELALRQRFLMRQKKNLKLILMITESIDEESEEEVNENDSDDDNDDDDEDDDKSTNIEQTDDDNTTTYAEDQVIGETQTEIAKEAEHEKSVEELKRDDQVTNAQPKDDQVRNLDSLTHKDKPEVLQSTSSHSLSSSFSHKFLVKSPNASLIGTIPENAIAEINSLLDIQIQHEVPNVMQEPYLAVKVLVILESTQAPPPPPPPPPLITAIEIPATQVSNSKALKSVVQRFTDLE
ncbi:hypothetical protein Tco_1222163 [Tanacetum coccineum]